MINYDEWEDKTIRGLYRQLNHSLDLLDKFDPEKEDLSNREQAAEFDVFMRQAIRKAYNDWMSDLE